MLAQVGLQRSNNKSHTREEGIPPMANVRMPSVSTGVSGCCRNTDHELIVLWLDGDELSRVVS
jgi:hypothetical protein